MVLAAPRRAWTRAPTPSSAAAPPISSAITASSRVAARSADAAETHRWVARYPADATGFAGSPTLLVDGRDLFPWREPITDVARQVT